MRRTLLLFMLICFASLANARIGETQEQCRKRYGDPSSEVINGLVYHKAGLILIIDFFKGHADSILFRKADTETQSVFDALSDDEILQLLKANSGARAWRRSWGVSADQNWTTEDGQLTALYDAIKHTLFIETLDCLNRYNAKKKAETAHRLQDF